MKKILLLAALFALLPLANGFAQIGSESSPFTITATVLTQLTVATDANLNFGNVFQSSVQHIDLDGAPTYVAGGAPTGAKFTITGVINGTRWIWA